MAVLGKPEDEKQAPETPALITRWKLVPGWVEPWRVRLAEWGKRTRFWRRRLLLFLAVVGPGVITSNVDNDAGGISVYSQAGAMYGYALAVVAHSHDHRALRHRRNVRAHGRRDRQGPFRSHPRRVRFPPHFFSDPCRPDRGHGQRLRRICRRRGLHAAFRHFQVHFRAACRAGRLDSGAARNLPRRSKRYFWPPAFFISPTSLPRFSPSRIGCWRRETR